MDHKLVLSDSVKTVLDNSALNSSISAAWAKAGYSSVESLLDDVVEKINLENPKWNLTGWLVKSGMEVYGSKCNYYAEIETDDIYERRCAYVFFTLPEVKARSAFFEQQFFPVISSVIDFCNKSSECHLTNMPVYVIGVSADTMTSSMATSCFAGSVVGFKYIDMMNNDFGAILRNNNGFDVNHYDIVQYDRLLKEINKKKKNSFFDLDTANKVIRFNNSKFIDKNGALKTNYTNEPYWFMLKALAAVFIVDKLHYEYDLTETNKLNGNKSMDAFKAYISKIGK